MREALRWETRTVTFAEHLPGGARWQGRSADYPLADDAGQDGGHLMLLARAGVPLTSAQLPGNRYNRTRTEYYRQLDRSSRANGGRDDPVGFVRYALQGLVERPVPRAELRRLGPAVAELYAGKTDKTLTRDINWLLHEDLIERSGGGYRARVDRMRSFRPPRAVDSDSG